MEFLRIAACELIGILLINPAKDLERFGRRASAPDFQLGSTAQING